MRLPAGLGPHTFFTSSGHTTDSYAPQAAAQRLPYSPLPMTFSRSRRMPRSQRS